MKKYFLLISIVLLSLTAWTVLATEPARHPLWLVSKGAQKAYLLGSIHYGSPDFYPLAAVIEQAYEAADMLVVEFNVLALDPIATAKVLLSQGMYPDVEHHLKHSVAPNTWRMLSEAAEQTGLPLEFLQQQKPWLAAMTLTAHVFQQAGFSEDLGIDIHFLKRTEDVKPIVELESFDAQIDLFDQFSEHEQEAFLAYTLKDLNKGDEYLSDIIEHWQAGDTDAIDTLLNETLQSDPNTRGLYQRLIADRNVSMTATVKRLMQQGEIPFVVVGAGHLVGDDGIARLLEEDGYRVEQQ